MIAGPGWLGHGEGGRKRMDNEADPVRIEVEAALKRSIPVIPVLVGGMRMPEVGDLPGSLKDFAFRHAVTIDGGRDFDHHMRGLIRALDRFFGSNTDPPAKPEMAVGEIVPPKASSPSGSSARIYGITGAVIVLVIAAAAVFFLNNTKPSTVAVQAVSAPIAVLPSGGTAKPSTSSDAEHAWSVTKNSTSIAVLNDFIRQFGDTPDGSMARARVQELVKIQTAAQPQAQPVTTPAPAPAPPPQAQQQAALVPTSASPSFSCTDPLKPDEQTVCRNGELSYLDRQLDVTFRALFNRLNRTQQQLLKDQEAVWLRQRAACLNSDACIRDAYQSRLAQLRSWP